MRNLVFSLLILTLPLSATRAADLVQTPLYSHLLGQAEERLDERAMLVGGMVEPDALLTRAKWVRKTMIEAVGGFPEKTPLNAKTVWKKDFEDYRIEGVLYESRPGFPVTANLYVPTTGSPPYPAVLGPCGHSKVGKAADAYQSAWINLARRGFVVLSFDPIGQGERMAYLDEEGKDRFWGTTEHSMLNVQSLLLGSSMAREMMWDGIRSVDYLISREEVDPKRIGCTGNSGGGTQTSFFMAVDPRIACAAPSCYVTSLKRLFQTIGPQDGEQNIPSQVALGIDHADYVEACLPRPVLICCASDDFFDIGGTWETFREAKGFYGRYGFPERVDLIEGPDKHGFSPPRRTAMYHWMARWLKSEVDEAPEPETRPLPPEELQVTKTGQVSTSFPETRTLKQIYSDEAAALQSVRQFKIDRAVAGLWKTDLARCVGSPRSKTLEWAGQADGENAEEGLAKHRFVAEIEPGWKIEVRTVRPNGEISGAPVVWLRDAMVPEADPRLGTPEDWARKGHPVTILTPRGLENAARRKGNLLYQYFGDWPTATLAISLGKPLLGQRVEDIQAALSFCAERFGEGPATIVAEGAATPPAIVTAVLDDRIGELILREGIPSWDSIFAAPNSLDVYSNVVPGILQIADLPEMVRSILPRKVTILSARTPEGTPLEKEDLEAVYADLTGGNSESERKLLRLAPETLED